MNFCIGICILSLQWMLTRQEVNVALGGIATQSSIYLNYFPANLAIDGNIESNLGFYSCACTNKEFNPWWRVDLLALHDISHVIVTNRGDACAERINGAEIYIGNSLVNNGNNNPRCVVISSIPAGASATYTCNLKGRYVNIVIPNIIQFLTLCEVEVYGVPVPVIKKIFLQLKFKTSEDLINPTIRDKRSSKGQEVLEVHLGSRLEDS
ncbi:fucolectin-like [Clarias gariepinus]